MVKLGREWRFIFMGSDSGKLICQHHSLKHFVTVGRIDLAADLAYVTLHQEWRQTMKKVLHFHFYDAGAYEGETEHRIMCNFYSLRSDGSINVGQSQLVLASEWPAYRTQIERNGWAYREHRYGAAA